MSKLPIEIINEILTYLFDQNNLIVTFLFHPITSNLQFKINFSSDLLWKIKAVQVMKKIYPLHYPKFPISNECIIKHKELIYHGLKHYECCLRDGKNFNYN